MAKNLKTLKNVRWVALGAAIGVAFGGIAYAVVVNPPNAADRYYACVSSGGTVKADTIRRVRYAAYRLSMFAA